jgi:glycogen synthase
MKVLMLGWELPPHNSGGLGVACYQLCKSLATKGADIEFVLPYEAVHDVDFMKVTAALPQTVLSAHQAGQAYDSVKYVSADGQVQWYDIFGQQQLYEQAVERMLDSQVFDVIHAHDWLTFRAGLKAKQRTGLPLILHVHSLERDRAGGEDGNPLVREIEAMCMQMADQVVAISKLTKDAIVHDYGIPADKIVVLHNSIDDSQLEELDAHNSYEYLSLMRTNGYHVVTNVGRLTLQKGLTNFLRAAHEVIERLPKTLFLIVGSGEQYHELIELAAELGIGRNVIFTGFQRGKPWRDAFAIADLFVMPSISEPFGLTPLEAIYYGTPSLISKQSGVGEVLHNCLRADFWDVHEMANQIAAVISQPVLRDELRDNAEKELKRLTWDTTASKLVDIYRQLGGVAA